MAKTRRISIKTETFERFTIIRRSYSRSFFLCADCGGESAAVELAAASELSGRNEMEIRRMVEGGVLHLVASPQGGTFICLNSIAGLLIGE
jgi:hypothetical protein